jgi:RNA polymerase sigma-70 factor (ECF subfamily)
MNSSEQEMLMDLTDEKCVERARDGHPEDFSLLVGRYQKPLYAYLARRLGNPSEAEEAAQESFVRAFFALKKLRKPGSFHSWLIGIAGRVLKEQFRSTKRRERDCEAAGEMLEADSGGRPEYPVEEAIAVLPETYRQVILLRYYEGLSCQELATRLELPLGTVTKRLSRAYALLRDKLKAPGSVAAAANHEEQP